MTVIVILREVWLLFGITIHRVGFPGWLKTFPDTFERVFGAVVSKAPFSISTTHDSGNSLGIHYLSNRSNIIDSELQVVHTLSMCCHEVIPDILR